MDKLTSIYNEQAIAQGQFMTPGYEGWERAWGVIAAMYGDTVCEDEQSGECWQYLGTSRGFHNFRHRAWKLKGNWMSPVRKYECVPVVDGDFEPLAAETVEGLR